MAFDSAYPDNVRQRSMRESGPAFSPRSATRLIAAAALALLLSSPGEVNGQTARISGFVIDEANGQSLEGATVALYPGDQGFGGSPAYGTSTTGDGLYLISGIDPGEYLLQVSYIGYAVHRDSIRLAADDVRTLTVSLQLSEESLGELFIESERLHGAARVTAGHQRITPADLVLIPAPDISGDLAGYLTTLPGIVTTGDRGGQLFVRGGEPTQNLVLFDGMIVYQPFHVLGFYSAFPAGVIDRVDLHAGGFGAKYAGRLSSVVEVAARPGNNRRFGGMLSASPFSGSLQIEGPIIPGHASFLVSARESFLEQTAEPLYGEPLPFKFGDLFSKIQVTPGARHRLAAAAFHTHDRGTLVAEIGDENVQEIRWTNSGASLRWLLLPRSVPLAAELTISRSQHEMNQGTRTDIVRSTKVRNTRVALDATFTEGSFFGGRATTAAGWEVVFGHTDNELGGLFQNVEDRGMGITSFGVYVEPEIIASAVTLEPGIRMQTYNVRHLPYFEPRLRLSAQLGIHHFSAGMGLYHQHVVGLNDRRDAASVFTAWSGIPRVRDRPARIREVHNVGPNTYEVTIPRNLGLESIGGELIRGRLGKSVHTILGYRSTPTTGLEYAVEGFYKQSSNLFVGEITALPRLTTRLLPATGRSVGFESRVELRRSPFYGVVTYGFSSTTYEADGRSISLANNVVQLRYRPAHDRRHQINVLVSTSAFGVDLSARWQFGSGLPYTRPLAFDGFVLVDEVETMFGQESSPRVVFDEPFGSRLPSYHRLDASVARTWDIGGASLTIQASAINIYDRRNVFYLDTYTLARKDQLPFIPSLGVEVTFD